MSSARTLALFGLLCLGLPFPVVSSSAPDPAAVRRACNRLSQALHLPEVTLDLSLSHPQAHHAHGAYLQSEKTIWLSAETQSSICSGLAQAMQDPGAEITFSSGVFTYVHEQGHADSQRRNLLSKRLIALTALPAIMAAIPLVGFMTARRGSATTANLGKQLASTIAVLAGGCLYTDYVIPPVTDYLDERYADRFVVKKMYDLYGHEGARRALWELAQEQPDRGTGLHGLQGYQSWGACQRYLDKIHQATTHHR